MPVILAVCNPSAQAAEAGGSRPVSKKEKRREKKGAILNTVWFLLTR
jgi:hypothetical protein